MDYSDIHDRNINIMQFVNCLNSCDTTWYQLYYPDR